MKVSSTLATNLLIAGVSAVPNVTVVRLDDGSCSSFPSWIPQPGADVTGSFQILIDQADDDAVNGLPAQEKTFAYWNRNETMLTMDLRKSRSIAKPYFRCINGTLRLGTIGSLPPISIGKDNRNAHLTLNAGYRVELYAHEIDGVRQPGMFLGALNQTTWGLAYTAPQACGELDYYEVKLQNLPLDPNTEPVAATPSSFYSFLKVIPS